MLELRERVGKLFDQLSYKKSEQSISVSKPYRKLLQSLYDGDEIDVDEVELILEQAGKTRQALESDLETLGQRFDAAKQLTASQTAQIEFSKASQEIERLHAEHDEFLRTWQPKIQAAQARLQAAELQSQVCHGAHTRLIGSVIDPELLAKQKSIDARRMELYADRQRIVEEMHEPQSQLRLAQAKLESAQSRVKDFAFRDLLTGAPATGLDRRKALDAQNDVSRWQPRVNAIQLRLDEIDRMMRQLDAEQRAIDQLKLIP